MSTFSVQNKWAHVVCLILIFLVAIITIKSQPVLFTGEVNTLGTIGFFATSYGVLFAIIELLRTKAAAQLANQEAERVFNTITSLITAREIIECQTTVQMAANAIDENKIIPTSTLLHIIKIYSQVYHSEVTHDDSEHRSNRSVLESYSFNPNVGSRNNSSKNTKRALLSIAGHLGQLQGTTKNFSEYKK